jgi:uncharacterized DUF497 family protein
MRILPKPIAFHWDTGNLYKNLKKHKVTVLEAEEMFINEPLTISADPKHSSTQEKRFQALGNTKSSRQLFAAFAIRDNKIRIISVRDMSRKEKEIYERLKDNS